MSLDMVYGVDFFKLLTLKNELDEIYSLGNFEADIIKKDDKNVIVFLVENNLLPPLDKDVVESYKSILEKADDLKTIIFLKTGKKQYQITAEEIKETDDAIKQYIMLKGVVDSGKKNQGTKQRNSI